MRKKKGSSLREKCPICNETKYSRVYPSTVDFGRDLNTKIFSARRLPDRIHGSIVKCRRCGLVRTLEIIDDSQLSKLYVNSRFTYKNLTTNLRASYGAILREAAGHLKQKRTFLEIGCGNGFMLEEALQIGFKKVSGIEPSRDAISRASEIVRPFIKQTILKPGIYKNGTFDMIAAFQVFDHIPDPNHFLETCRSLLSPRGVLVLMNHDVEALSARVLGEKSPIIDIEHTYLYSQKTIAKILKKNKLKVISVYSPPAFFSLRYFLRLLPLQQGWKRSFEKSKSFILDLNLKLKPGNLCVISTKK